MSRATLRQDWQALLERRPTLKSTLVPYDTLLAAWADWANGRVPALGWGADECQARWRRGVPLLAEGPPAIRAADLEGLVGTGLELLATAGTDGAALERLAEAWDRGAVEPPALFPGPGRIGSLVLQEETGLTQEALAFLACASLPPVLEPHFLGCAAHLVPGVWNLAVCPFCGAPPGFADLLENGQRWLACHLCAGGWPFPRLRCVYCGSQDPQALVRLVAEGAEEGYAITACKACGGYLKELDRRLRWNAGPALIEDWGSPHLDLIATRQGYWRAVPTLVQLSAA